MATATKEKAEVILIDVEGRGINLHLFERDIYKSEGGGEGKAMYKAEMAYDPDAIVAFEDKLAAFAEKVWGKGAGQDFLDGKNGFISPLIEGDLLAKGKEEKGKPGDAYKGKLVLRTKTAFNKDGLEGPGGIRVYGPDASIIGAANQTEVYNGCMGKLAVTLKEYKDYPRRGDKGITVYLNAFQKTADGEPLRAASGEGGAPSPFAPVAAPAAGRRVRAG